MAVRGFIAEKLRTLTTTRPDASGTFVPASVFVSFPRDPVKAKATGLYVMPAEIEDCNYLDAREGNAVADSEDLYAAGTWLVDHGEVEVPFVIQGIAQSEDVCTLMLTRIRQYFRNLANRADDSFADYFDQEIRVAITAYSRVELPEIADRGVYVFEVKGSGQTKDVSLQSASGDYDVSLLGTVEE